MISILLALTFLTLQPQSISLQQDDPELARLFTEAGVKGTIVIADLEGQRLYVHDAERAARRQPVASTFKIFNSLISLEEGAIGGANDRLVWDGTVYKGFPDWNHDQTLASAFKVSCVWCYQELARRVGAGKYRRHITRAGYGQLADLFNTTTFWLDGSLRASAFDQVEFLRKVVRRSLPYRKSSYDTLREIMLAEEGPGYTLRAKTGWTGRGATPPIGWYVGYVERSDGVWLFALNLEFPGEADLALRQKIAKRALQAKAILP